MKKQNIFNGIGTEKINAISRIRQEINILLALLLILSVSWSICVAEQLPKPDKNGDYSGDVTHRYWKVVDLGPGGLNGRLSGKLARIWYEPGIKWPRLNIGQWPVIRMFQRGTILIANGEPASYVTMNDENGKPWLSVNIGNKKVEAICFVRANKKSGN